MKSTFSDVYTAALAWATHQINEEVSLLQQIDRDSFTVFDYALDLLSGEVDALPDENWSIVVGAATPAELLSIGYTAWVTCGIFQHGLEAWSKAAESGDPDVSSKATYNIGHMFQVEGRTAEAEAMYERVIDSGDRTISFVAMSDLGHIKFRQGQISEAIQLYRRVLDNADDQWAIALTHLRMGEFLEAQNNYQQAREWYNLVLESGYYELIPQAELGLAHTDLRDKDVLSARAHYHKAINSGHTVYAPKAALQLATLLIKFDQAEEACRILRIAVEIWNDNVSPFAAGLLGQLLESDGQAESAHDVYSIALKSGHKEAIPAAAIFFGSLLEEQDKLDEALKLYQGVTKCGIEKLAAEATAHAKRLDRKG